MSQIMLSKVFDASTRKRGLVSNNFVRIPRLVIVHDLSVADVTRPKQSIDVLLGCGWKAVMCNSAISLFPKASECIGISRTG